MDNETRHLQANDPARVAAGWGTSDAPPAAPETGAGTPTTYLPPVTAAPASGPVYSVPATPAGGPAHGGPSTPRAGGSRYTVPASAPFVMRGRSNWVPLVLIAVGVFALFGGFHLVFGAAFPLALGLIFLYASNQAPGRWGLRIPGAILTGLGAGIMLDAISGFESGGFSALGLGLGFVSLWAMNRAQWWWLIPGAAVGLGGLQALVGGYGLHSNIIFPLVLIAAGAYLLRNRRGRVCI